MAETLVDITALNRSSHPATLFYVADVEGSAPVPYATLEPNERKSQQSFAGHRWRLTCNGCDTSTELCATPDLELRIGGCACGDAPIPEEFYHHSKLVGVAGLRVRAAAVVSAEAVDAAAKILAEMLRHSPPSILARLDAAGCAVSVIGREQKTSDIPEHRAWARECATSACRRRRRRRRRRSGPRTPLARASTATACASPASLRWRPARSAARRPRRRRSPPPPPRPPPPRRPPKRRATWTARRAGSAGRFARRAAREFAVDRERPALQG